MIEPGVRYPEESSNDIETRRHITLLSRPILSYFCDAGLSTNAFLIIRHKMFQHGLW